jgi:hypothetical protein
VDLLRKHFARHILLNTLPGKQEIERVTASCGIDRPWKNVKDYVRHLIKKKL